MERGLGAWALLVAGITFSLAIGAAWLQWTVFSPSDSGADAAAILQDAEIRQNLRDLISAVAAPTMGTTESQLSAFLDEEILSTRAGAEVMGETVGRIERVVIGQSTDQVVITGSALVPIVRDQRAAGAADITVPVETSGTMNTMRKIATWMVPIGILLALVFMIMGVFMRPERHEIRRAAGETFVAVAISVLLFGLLIPGFVLPGLDSHAWVAIAPRLAYSKLPWAITLMVVTSVAGALLILSSFTGGSTRRQWSTPLSANRYRTDRPTWG